MYLDEAKRQFAQAQLASPDAVEPCTTEEVTALETQVGALPDAYKELLLWMGHRAGAFLRGTDVFYDRLACLAEGAQERLAENHMAALAQGYLRLLHAPRIPVHVLPPRRE
jgi:hypothetical protein